MRTINEGRLKFEFPDSFTVVKYDDTDFFQENFKKVLETNRNNGKCTDGKKCKGNKVKGVSAVDILAVDKSTTYLIEVKDYTNPHPNAKVETTIEELADTVARKVLFTLAALMPMRNNPFDDEEKNVATKSLITKKIAVVLHLEILKDDHIYLDPSEILIKLEHKMERIDPVPQVVSVRKMMDLAWNVEEKSWDEYKLNTPKNNNPQNHQWKEELTSRRLII